MKRLIAALLVCALALSSLVACGGSSSAAATPSTTPEPTPVPTPVYDPDPLTGREKTADFAEDQRLVAVMINNIAVCRPQRGLSTAKVLVESKVEGGITRFMGLFDDAVESLPDIGPVRSGRDQFLRLVVPYQALYCHIGRSGVTQTYIDENEYRDLDLDGNNTNFIYRDNRGGGYALEHTAYTNGEELSAAIKKGDYDMAKSYSSPIFDFVNYNEAARTLSGESALSIGVVHSQSYRTYFEYDLISNRYMMSQYSSSRGVTPTIDENDGEQVGFENLIVIFADIEAYPYPGGNLDANGNDKGDPDYQKVDYTFGGYGYYVNGGVIEPIRWFKGSTGEVLRFTDMTGDNSLKVNTGRTYLGIVDLDEHDNFSWAGADESVANSAPEANSAAAEAEAAAEAKGE